MVSPGECGLVEACYPPALLHQFLAGVILCHLYDFVVRRSDPSILPSAPQNGEERLFLFWCVVTVFGPEFILLSIVHQARF